jgi:hypothetical protein
MPSTNPDDFVDEELDELERRLEQELQALEGQDDGGASEMIRARDLAEEVRGTHEDHGLQLRYVQDWLDEWVQPPAYGGRLDIVMGDYRAKLPEETRVQIEQAMARMAVAVEDLTAAVWALRDYNDAVTEVWRQRLPADWGGWPRRRTDSATH